MCGHGLMVLTVSFFLSDVSGSSDLFPVTSVRLITYMVLFSLYVCNVIDNK